jgi:hypothetical protein
MSRIKCVGWIELHSNSGEYVTSRPYDSPKRRNDIINAWKRKYPNRTFYITIIPEFTELPKNKKHER